MRNEDEEQSGGEVPDHSADSWALESLSDDELVAACLIRDERNPEAFTELVRRCSDVVRRAAQRALAKAPRPVACDDDDLVQGFFAHVQQHKVATLGKFLQARGDLRHFLAVLAYRHSLKQLQSPSVTWPGDCLPTAPAKLEGVADRHHDAKAERIVDHLLATLSSTTRSIVQAKFGLEPFALRLPVAQIAKQHGMSERSVYRKLATVLRGRLRKLLDSLDDD